MKEPELIAVRLVPVRPVPEDSVTGRYMYRRIMVTMLAEVGCNITVGNVVLVIVKRQHHYLSTITISYLIPVLKPQTFPTW